MRVNWTTSYPTTALFPMAALMREARATDFAQATVPALFLFSDGDSGNRPHRNPAREGGMGRACRGIEAGDGSG